MPACKAKGVILRTSPPSTSCTHIFWPQYYDIKAVWCCSQFKRLPLFMLVGSTYGSALTFCSSCTYNPQVRPWFLPYACALACERCVPVAFSYAYLMMRVVLAAAHSHAHALKRSDIPASAGGVCFRCARHGAA